MRFLYPAILLAFSFAAAQGADLKGVWSLEKSELIYRVTHPLHKVVGKSVAARGKGECGAKGCEFLVAVPVKSFDSKDGNRDAHMWQTVKAGLYPMVQVKLTKLKGAEAKNPRELTLDAEVEFGGKKAAFPGLQLTVVEWGKGSVRLKGTLALSLKAFSITPPSLLTIPVRDEVPVELDLTWKRK